MSQEPALPSSANTVAAAARVIVVSSVMFSFISYWRTAAVVLCDLASTSYYIGGIVEQSIGRAAPWFILAVMLFSYAVRSVYIESCSLFVRGGVYRVVKEALGGFVAKLSVSALMFDYILTGPISGVSAGQYLMGLALETITYFTGHAFDPATRDAVRGWGAVVFACAITLYFWRQNVIGLHESSDKALKIMLATAVMAVVVFVWCGITLWAEGPRNTIPLLPDLAPKLSPVTHELESPLGFLRGTGFAEKVSSLHGWDWLSLIGVLGLFIAFGHSILAMSGEETLAQVYREVEAPKLKNFKKAAIIVFVFSLLLTGGISFVAVLLIPNDVRMAHYADNLIGGLAMNVIGPMWARLLLNAFVVCVGALILSGAVNTAIIGSNGVLNRVAEDGVLPPFMLRPHPKFGTTYRMLYLILGLQLFTIIASRGDVLLLGEAYAFGVVWSFVFKALAMVVLRFRDKGSREYKVPLNLRVGKIELPIGLMLIFLVLLVSAIMNLLTKNVATTWGLAFTAAFVTAFIVTEKSHQRQRKGEAHEHMEQFNQQASPAVSRERFGLRRPFCKLVAIRSPHNLAMLEKALAETDPETTDVVVMTAKVEPAGSEANSATLDTYDQRLMTAVVERAEHAGKRVHPLIVPTNNPLYAVIRTAHELKAQELVMGLSNKFSADDQLDQIALYWFNLHEGQSAPLTVRVMSRERDLHLDLGGGSRIPRAADRQAKTVAELRAGGVGVDRVLLLHDGTAEGSDLFESVLTALDPDVVLDIVRLGTAAAADAADRVAHDCERAAHLGREVKVHGVNDNVSRSVAQVALAGQYDLIVAAFRPSQTELPGEPAWTSQLLHDAHCRVLLATTPAIPQEVTEH